MAFVTSHIWHTIPIKVSDMTHTAMLSIESGMPQAIAAALKAARVVREMTQSDLATKAGLSLRTVARIERGEVSVSLNAWLATVIALDLEELLQPLADPAADKFGQQQRLRAQALRVRHVKSY